MNQVDDVVMSSGEKGDTYVGVSDDFSQIVSSRGSNVPNADSNIVVTCHDVLSSDVKYQSCSSDLNEHHNQNLSISNTHSPTEVREDKNIHDNMSRDVSPGVIPNRMVEARPTNKDLVRYSDHSQNASTQASTSAGLGEPTATSAQNVNEIPHFYFPNVTSIEHSLFIVNCNDAYVSDDRVPKEKIVKVGTKDPSPSIEQAVSAGLSSSSSKFVESFQSFADKVLEEKSNVIIEPSTLNGRVHERENLNHEKCLPFSLDRKVSIKLNDKTWDIITKRSI